MSIRFICDHDSLTDRRGRFTIEPLEKGAGAVIGNALRRVLLSQLEGAAVTAVRIQGVLHEFASIPGAVEDTPEVIRNLRCLALKMAEPGTGIMHITGKGVVTARDLTTDNGVTVLNPDAHIVTLEAGAKFEAELEVCSGTGFKQAPQDGDIGVINVDTDFSPVRRAGYKVVEIEGCQESLSLELETNGSINPVDAVKNAAAILKSGLTGGKLISSKFDATSGEFVLPGGHTMGSLLRWALMSYCSNQQSTVSGQQSNLLKLSQSLRSEPVIFADYTIQKDGSLMLEVHTDGSLNPKDALSRAKENVAGIMDILLGTQVKDRGRHQAGIFEQLTGRRNLRCDSLSFGDASSFWRTPDLLDVQFSSYQRFLQKDIPPQDRKSCGLEKILSETFPIKNNGLSLECLGYSYGEPAYTPIECLDLSLTYSIPVTLQMQLTVEKTGKVIEEEIPLCEIPFMSEDGTFIINGLKRVVIGQLAGLDVNDYNDLSKKTVKAVGDFLYEVAAEAFARLRTITNERMAVECPSAENSGELSPSSLLNFEPVVLAMTKFFTRSRYSQVAQECNALDRLTHCRRLRQDSAEFDVEEVPAEPRTLSNTAYGRICPLETPEGPSVGLIGTLVSNAVIDEGGFIRAPYRKIKDPSGQVVYLSAQEEEGLAIADCSFDNQKSKLPARIGSKIAPGEAGRDVQMVSPEKVDYVDASRQQTLGISASLIPLLEHNDPNRALMGCNMQRQAVPLLFAEQPFIQSGAEGKAALDSREAVVARSEGIVKRVNAERIEILTDDGMTDVYQLLKHRRAGTINTWVNQKPLVTKGQKVAKGQVIADGSSTKGGLLALGRNILVAYMPWEGYNFEDAILVSERLIKDDVFTSLHIQNYQTEVRDTRYGREMITRRIPGFEESMLSHLDPDGIVRVGTYVREGDILVGKVTPKAIELKPEDKLLQVITGESENNIASYDDASLRLPPGTEGRITKVMRLPRDKGDHTPGRIRVEVTTKRKAKVGDKLSGRHGNKGTISIILPEEDMPFMSDGTPVEMALSPLGVPTRMNLGQILETHLGWAAKTLGVSVVSPPYDGPDRLQIKDLLGKAGLPVSGMTEMHDGRTGRAMDTDVTVGYQYTMKLIHMVDDKIHARSTGPYSLFTQQPTGGKTHFGGQRFGEMETWALEAYGAAYMLRELLTVKSDDVTGRRKVYESLLKGSDSALTPSVPETLKKLILCLRGVAFDMKPVADARHKTQDVKEGNVSSCPEPGVLSLEAVTVDEIDAMTIALASPEKIRSEWSNGLVYIESALWENHHPAPDGLFCEKIFGPIRDWQCQCGKLSGKQFEGQVCDECGVAVGPASMRNERMGHIELAVSVCHNWYLTAKPSPVSILLNMDPDEIRRVIYYENYIVTDAGNTDLKYRQVISSDEYEARRKRKSFQARTGAAVIRDLLSQLDLEKLAESLDDPQKKRVVEAFQKSGVKPEWMILECLPVLPPGMRPTRHLEGGEVATLDLNELYTRIISRNNKYKELVGDAADSQEAYKMARMIQEAVDSLFGNGRRSEGETGKLRSISDLLKGKEGMFRSNLLGKRVDYSGRSVIVVGPELKLNECGLPESMALELFRPFIMHKLMASGAAHSISSARKMVDNCTAEARKAVREVAQERLVMLNRAPTLHRVGIQTFKPVLTDLSAIRLHPLVCVGFNADFDGDQMAVHIPLSAEAQEEARLSVLSQKNVLSATHGGIMVPPTQDMILGFYYMTKDNGTDSKHEVQFTSTLEVKKAYELGRVGLHDRIQFTVNGNKINTIVGRVLFNEIVPPGLGRFINQDIDSGSLCKLIEECHARLGEDETARFLNDLDDLGFRYATRLGASIGLDTLKTIPDKDQILEEAETQDDMIKNKGEISYEESQKQRFDLWLKIMKKLADSSMNSLEAMNPVFMMVASGARGKPHQLTRLIGAGGIMATPTGELYGMPVASNYMDGMSTLEHYIITAGARYGLIATAVISGRAGSLMRRMVSASQDVIVTEEDCGTSDGIIMTGLKSDQEIIRSLSRRISGRIAAHNVKHPETGEIIVSAGSIISEKAQEIESSGIREVKVLSPFTCEAEYGICARCYGVDLATGAMAKLGSPVGVIAGTAVGEPATQLTFRLFHLRFGREDYTITGLPRLEALMEARENVQIMVDGSPMPLKEILSQKGEEPFRSIMLDELVGLYGQYGLDVNDKHFEILLSRMLSRMRITDPGDTKFYPGELISRTQLRLENRKVKARQASAEPVLMGLHRAALETDSFLAAAAFGDTINVLAQAAIRCSRDELRGMRESLIVGKLIPAGTGFRKGN